MGSASLNVDSQFRGSEGKGKRHLFNCFRDGWKLGENEEEGEVKGRGHGICVV